MLLVMIFVLALMVQTSGVNIMCYFMNTSPNASGVAKFTPENINPKLCTHIYYMCAQPDELKMKHTQSNDEDLIARIMKLKQVNSKLKIILVVGCSSGDVPLFYPLMKSETSMEIYAMNAVQFARQREFDGIEINCQMYYGIEPLYKANFTLLLQAIKKSFLNESGSTGNPRLLLSVVLPNNEFFVLYSYEMKNLTKIVDYMTIMSYDFHGPWEKFVGFSAPLYKHTRETWRQKEENVDWIVKYYVNSKNDASKLHIGIPSFARTFTLTNKNKHDVLSPSKGTGNAGNITGTKGLMAFYEVCAVIRSGGTEVKVPSQCNSYVIKGDQWISSEEKDSIKEKVCYAIKLGLGGVTFKFLHYDDFLGNACNEGQFPLLSSISKTLNDSETKCKIPYVSTMPTTSRTTEAPPQGPFLKETDFRVICFLTRYLHVLGTNTRFSVVQLDTHLCTHVTYTVKLPQSEDYNYDGYQRSVISNLTAMKEINPRMKIMLTLVSSFDGMSQFNALTQLGDTRKKFVRNTVTFLRDRKIDGVNMYIRLTNTQHKVQYQLLMEELKEAFHNDARDRGLPRLLLVSTVSGPNYLADGYDVPKLIKCIDFLIVSAVGYYGWWDNFTYFQSPLYHVPGQWDQLNVDYTVRNFMKKGASNKKNINIVVPIVASAYMLKDNSINGIRSSSRPLTITSGKIKAKGYMAYYEVCDFIKSGAFVSRTVSPHVSNYAVMNFTWVSFEDERSIRERTCYAKKQGFGGIALYDVDYDDFSGMSCNKGRYPLMKTAFKVATSQDNCTTGFLASISGAHRQAHLIYTDGKLISNELLIIWSLLTGLYVMQSTI